MDKKDAQLYYKRGLARYTSEDYEKSVIDFTSAIQLNDKYTQAYEYRALSYRFLNSIDNACMDWRIASGLGSNTATESMATYCK